MGRRTGGLHRWRPWAKYGHNNQTNETFFTLRLPTQRLHWDGGSPFWQPRYFLIFVHLYPSAADNPSSPFFGFPPRNDIWECRGVEGHIREGAGARYWSVSINGAINPTWWAQALPRGSPGTELKQLFTQKKPRFRNYFSCHVCIITHCHHIFCIVSSPRPTVKKTLRNNSEKCMLWMLMSVIL